MSGAPFRKAVTFNTQPRLDSKWAPIAEALRRQPRKWARLDLDASGSTTRAAATHIKRGHFVAFRPAGHYEAKTENYELWARYVGDGQPEQPELPMPRLVPEVGSNDELRVFVEAEVARLRAVEARAREMADPDSGFTSVERASARYILGGAK